MILNKLFKTSLKKTLSLVLNSKKTREEIFEDVEEQLILADISMDLVVRILENVRKNSKLTFEKDDFFVILKEEIIGIFNALTTPVPTPPVKGKKPVPPVPVAPIPTLETSPSTGTVILLVGINGCGKTTTAAKLAYYYQSMGKNVLLSAADTFRAAGSSQLSLWGERLNIPVIGAERGADPGSVVYNSLTSFINKSYDVLIIDTAGRVQTRDNLMKELEKITKIIKKFIPTGPSDTLLVVDGTQGQNTMDQAKRFKTFSGITGLVLSKVDGTAKGGTVLNIVNEMRIPVKFIGTGETEKDIAPFSATDFADSLLSDE